jgi:RimJ/RimL family protein N-acetyltransferase
MLLRKKLGSAVRVLQEQGGRALVREIAGKIFDRTVFVAIQRDLKIKWKPVKCEIPFELMKLNDETIRSFKNMPEPFPRHYQYRFEYGLRQCYAAVHNDKIVALMWPFNITDNAHMVTKWRFLLADETRVSNIWADPAYRGTGLMPACIECFALLFKSAGYRYMYCFTWEHNQASIRFHEKLGFRVVGKIVRYSFPLLKEGTGIYFRGRIPREPLAAEHATDDFNLPERITRNGESDLL